MLFTVFSLQLPVASCRLPVASLQLPVASCQLPVAGCRLPGYWLLPTGYWLLATVYWLLLFNSFHVLLPVRFPDIACRDLRVVLEKYQILAFDRLAHEVPLERQRLHRVEVVSHDPRFIDVRRGGHEVRREDGGVSARLQVHDLMETRVAARAADADAWHDRLVAAREINHAGIVQGQEVVRHVTRAVALVRVRGIV